MTESDFEAKRAIKEYRQTINASPEEIFPLLCPVREAEWLGGWKCTMIYSKSGLVEEGAVFSTPHDSEHATVWIVTKYDPRNLMVEFTRFTHQSRVCVLRIVVSSIKKGSSHVDISYTYTGIAPSGNDFIARLTDEEFHKDMKFWEDSMNHYLKTGEQLKRG
jgi:hypothetical protein